MMPSTNGHAIEFEVRPEIARQFDRLPPHSDEAEQCLLASMMLDKSTIGPAAEIVDRTAFYFAAHQTIWDTLVRLHQQGRPIDAVIVREELRSRGLYDEIGGDGYIGALLNRVPSAAHAEHYAGIVREKAALRHLIEASNDMLRAAYGPHESAAAILDRARERIGDIPGRSKQPRPVSIDELEAANPAPRPIAIDGLLHLCDVGQITGASKAMKTWLADALAISFASGREWLGHQTMGGKVLYFDAELHPKTIINRTSKIASALGIAREEYAHNLRFLPMRGRRMNLNTIDPLMRSLGDDGYSLIIIDPIYRLYPPGFVENDAAGWIDVGNKFLEWATILNLAIMFVHHSPKGIQGGRSALDVGSGSGVQARFADLYITIREHEDENCAVMDAIPRDFAQPPPAGLRWNFPIWFRDDDIDVERIRKESSKRGRPPNDVKAGIEAASKAAEWTPERFVAEFVREEPQPIKVVIAAANQAKIAFRKIDGLIAQAEAAGMIYRLGNGKNGVPVRLSTRKPDLFTPEAANPMTRVSAKRMATKLAGLFSGQIKDKEFDLIINQLVDKDAKIVGNEIEAYRLKTQKFNLSEFMRAFQ
ncbi:MAG TPA: DnaB-like helicase N-terminal domain-containing protein [Tepidisphaeraceae bacterium]|jgi:hypothetical protein|nr:DnaB-like helicase N-terminal domain-containing protein [Tepidisphaeraceae bacterium]